MSLDMLLCKENQTAKTSNFYPSADLDPLNVYIKQRSHTVSPTASHTVTWLGIECNITARNKSKLHSI